MAWQIFQFSIKIIFSLAPVGLFFIFYFKNFVFRRSLLVSLAPFFWGILSSVLTVLIQWVLPQQVNNWIKAFIYAALIEECIRLLFLSIMIYMARETFTITEGIFDCVMIGLGFAFAENLHYAFNVPGNIVFLRTISSVPLHVFASGIMGYFAGYLFLNQEPGGQRTIKNWFKLRNLRFAALALCFPILIHGLYDYSLLQKGNLIYLVPLILIASFILLEYLIDIGHLVFGRNILKMLKIKADDVMIIIRQQNYERWVSRRQKTRERPHLFQSGWPPWQTAFATIFLLIGVIFAIAISMNLFPFLSHMDLSQPALISLLVLYPLTLSTILFLDARINYAFFRDINSHVPLTALVNVLTLPDSPAYDTITPGSKQELQAQIVARALESEEVEQFTFVMDILPTGVFLPIQEKWQPGKRLCLEFVVDSQKTIFITGTLQWANQYNKTLPLGYICRIETRGLDFLRFRLNYTLRKIMKIPTTYRKLIEQDEEIGQA